MVGKTLGVLVVAVKLGTNDGIPVGSIEYIEDCIVGTEDGNDEGLELEVGARDGASEFCGSSSVEG